MIDIKLPYGLHKSGRMVAAADVPRGAACDCLCPECSTPLVAKQGDVLRWHFAHESDPTNLTGRSCSTAFETMVHQLAKQIIADAGRITIPPIVARCRGRHRIVEPERTVSFGAQVEHWLGDIRRRPDVFGILHDGQGPIAIEVYVTHRCPPNKRSDFERLGIPAVEIDLSGYKTAVPHERIVLATARREWIFHPGQNTLDEAFKAECDDTDRMELEEAARRLARAAEFDRRRIVDADFVVAERNAEFARKRAASDEQAKIWQEERRRRQEIEQAKRGSDCRNEEAEAKWWKGHMTDLEEAALQSAVTALEQCCMNIPDGHAALQRAHANLADFRDQRARTP